MKNTINKEEAAGVLQSSITSVSCMFPSIFTKDDVIRLLNEVQEKIEALPSEQAQPVLTQVSGTYGCAIPNSTAFNDTISISANSRNETFSLDITDKKNIKELTSWLLESVQEYIEDADLSGLEIDIEYETEENYGNVTVTATADTSGIASKVYSELDFEDLEQALIGAIEGFIEQEDEKAAYKSSQTNEN
jgi:hypothetical protein